MSQQRPYEGFSYPAEFQSGVGGAGDTTFPAARATPPASTFPAGAVGGVSNTGLTRRSAQHTGSALTSNFASAVANSNASSTGNGPVTVPINASSPSGNGQVLGSYGYFHGHGNSIDVNSGYNSDSGSSASNLHYMSGSGYPMTGMSSRVADVAVGVNETSNATDVSPVRLPPAPRFTAARQGSAVPGASCGDGNNNSGGGGVFQTGGSDGRAGSAANSTRSSVSGRPPVAPPAFLPSRPFPQTPPHNLSSPPPGGAAQAHSHQQQPYMLPMPSSMHSAERHGGNDPLGDSGSPDLNAAPRLPFMMGPSTAGPRMPTVSSDSGHGYGGGGGGGGASTSLSGGFLGRFLTQVLPTFDDGNSMNAQGGGGGSLPRERPPYQLRFGCPEDDLPLLEELGIFPRHILDKARAVLNPFKTMSVDAAKDPDLAGPVLFALSLALLLSLRGKIQFSAIYGLFVLGVAFFKVLLSLMQPKGGGAPLQLVVSTVGYGLLPTVLLALVRTTCSWLLTRRSLLPLTLLMILWSAWCGSSLVAKGLGMEEQRYLVLYPMLLFYAAFDALTVFWMGGGEEATEARLGTTCRVVFFIFSFQYCVHLRVCF
ncbi:putative mitochondrial membrane protein YIP1 [Leptomonas pyrrhocoris]|uniref:Putative mitochondrial membrane protein YIP1 n=1 Tax=Leptomonas pyrrhocoris TaxID=157538 RepID=A0A0N0VCY2_LEPPY|nr:putative mitochondrial membrane protein YIP1 [Leptomonas pyrrhocoris]KPA74144.1 putative mitochondrial membrane protein YIP1 [Leptomonas pyrrhocoris]|eukprot:XP_015652583.1 putative mitochondrial membrane protein YIP1 [Leptomonas pyrrhocoris]